MRNPYISLLSTAWQYARKDRKRYVLVYAMFIMANIVFAMNPLLYGWFVDALQREGTDIISSVWIYGLGFLGLRLLEWAFHGPARVMERKLAFSLSFNYLDELYHKVLHLPVKWHQDHHSGASINRIRKAYEALKDFFQNGFVYIHAFGKFLFSFGAMLYFSPIFGSIGVLLGAFTIWIIIRFDKPFIKSLKEVQEKEHVVYSTLFDSLSNIITVITLRLELQMQTSFMGKVANVFPAFRRNVTVNEVKWFTAQMLVGLIYSVVTVGYVYQHWQPGETFYIGGLIILLGYVNQFTSVFNDIASQYTKIVQYHTEIETVKGIENAYHEHHRPETSEVLPENWQSLSIEHLHFVRNESVQRKNSGGLYDLNIRLQRGQRIALIGESGSGKSTLLALLRGLYSPQSVQVKIDNRVEVKFEDIANTVTLFPQDPEIFENTIRYNITLGLPFSEDDIMRVCEIAKFAEVVKQLPHGLDTHIQEKGVNLSGGQKQRLALARGILAARTSNIVLLDEPTSSVDPRTEVMIYDKMFQSFGEKAVISSLHRLHLLTKFDYIYVLQEGKVVDEGTFEDLKLASDVFKELWQHQIERAAV